MAATDTRQQPDGTGLIALDSWLGPFEGALRHRHWLYSSQLAGIHEAEGSLEAFSRGHERFGLNRGECDGEQGVWYREWAPAAESLRLIGDFNGWDRAAHPMHRDEYGVWSIFLPDGEYATRLVHASRIKVHVVGQNGAMDRIPAYVRRAIQEADAPGKGYVGQYWCPPDPYVWQNEVPDLHGSPRVYEAHVGMAMEEERLGSYAEFARNVLPRIADAGYNVVQLMAIQEHPYYASFGYQVSNFFAPSSRFGTPEDLKSLIDTAHGLGIRVFIDLVHSHAVKNLLDGLNQLDGTDFHYFHGGPRGMHPAWDSCVFDYGKYEVLRFLLSNVRYWLEEFRFDGIRFDGVTSMLYLDHGLERDFTSYGDYFSGVDEAAVVYLKLANTVAHEAKPSAMTVAEEVSGMIGLARSVEEGGMGFDYRLAMGIPDYWIKLLKEKSDEQWSMGELYQTLVNRRVGENHIAYAESHDQALVGDKTLACRLMGVDMYYLMSKALENNHVIERGVALHKMIRLITFALGGEGYLNFMGNEFGHPEWIDFPRAGNNDSYQHARRQWSLTDDVILRYHDLAEFDKELLMLDSRYNLLSAERPELLSVDEERKTIICRRGRFVFAFNFHASVSHADLRFGVPEPTDYELLLNTDEFWFSGHGIVTRGEHYPWQPIHSNHHDQSLQIYIPARSGLVIVPTSLVQP